MEFVIAIICMLVWGAIKAGKENAKEEQKKAQELKQAQSAYETALAKLKENPNNPDLKGNALKTGRQYANLCRDKEGNTIFDEVALMNDINAACAAAQLNPPQTGQSDIEERIKTLDRLLANGMIGQTEYQQRRKRILDSL